MEHIGIVHGHHAYDSNCKICVLQAEVKEQAEEIKVYRRALEGALRISDLWTLKEIETQFEDEAKALETMRISFEQALKGTK